MYLLRKRFSDKVYRTGVISLGISLLLYCLPALVNDQRQAGFGVFLFNFGLTAFYFIYRLIEKKRVSKEARIHHVILLLLLLFISAWALNQEIAIFERSAGWFSALLVLVCANSMAMAYFAALPRWARHFTSFLNGITLAAFLYLSLYLMPLYVLGAAASPVLGLSVHVFVPALLFTYSILLQNRIARRNKQYQISFAGGLTTALVIVVAYVAQWYATVGQVNRAWMAGAGNTAGLPAWVAASQNLAPGYFVQTVLKGDLVYSSPKETTGDFFWSTPVRSRIESRKHDPLVMIASFFSPRIGIDEESRIKLLETAFDLHHEAEERLWSDEELRTDSVITEVKIWPRCNLAYTEKTILVANTRDRNAWSRQGEAIYTFYMPEGSVVTSLSLWIQGKEEKGILTAKGRADSAYRTIVGVEQRDPSVAHWQEGNTVLVRVFPVIAGERRQFKIGITSPLERTNGSLRYENIYFKGPAYDKAQEHIRVDFEQPVSDFDLPASFVSKASQSYSRKGRYQPVWGLQINDPGLSGCSFSFGGSEYSLSPYHRQLSAVEFTGLYLDINHSWTREEFGSVLAASKGRPVWVYDNGLMKLDETNREQLWEKLHRRRFSLFPLYEITNAEQTLLVTKNAVSHMRLADLEETEFMNRTRQFFSKGTRINVFNLGDELSPFLRSLKEFRVLRYDNGEVDLLVQRLQKGQFAGDIENAGRVVIHRTDMVVEKTVGTAAQSGPDHVMRLFSYNHIMQQLGAGLWLNRSVEDSLVQEAQTAYVVTPVSSLVVLETQDDYERFGIHDTGNSLKNASLHAKGAVPEPHEWALIGLVAALLAVLLYKKRKTPYQLQ
ncbi:MAG: XrtN system VIT domain-containing protein [Chitinophagaceae bacterium]